MTPSLTYPPPLSAPPTTATLRGLLDGLQAGAAAAPPSPPLPGTQPGRSPVRAAMETVSIAQWHVEHVTTGVPVRLSIGDPLTTDELARLRDELRRPVAVEVPPWAPAGDPPDVTGPALGFAARTARRRRWVAGAGAAGVALALVVARLVGLDLPLP